MRIETVEYKVYKYNELSAEAKEKVKQWYLEGQEPFIFTEMCEDDLYNLFGKNDLNGIGICDLKVQYSLSNCQGDGLNIYGKINPRNILECLENHNGCSQLEEFENYLTDKEKATILLYADYCDDISIPYNTRYCYSLANDISFAEDWLFDIEDYEELEKIDFDVINKFEKLVANIFLKLCQDYEKQGYKYFYEISEEDLEEICDCNMYEFLEDGTVF